MGPRQVVAAGLAALSVLFVVTGIVLQLLLPPEWSPGVPANPDYSAGLMFPLVGAFLVAQRPRHVLAWVMCLGGLACAVHVGAQNALLYAASQGELGLAALLRFPASIGWAVGGIVLATLLPLYAPDGRGSSPTRSRGRRSAPTPRRSSTGCWSRSTSSCSAR